MRITFTMTLLLVAGLAGCIQAEDETPDNSTTDQGFTPEPVENVTVPEPAPVDPNSLPGIRFLAIGDQGTGGEGQYKVAAAMKSICELRGCDFVLTLGDNIYETGPSDVNDPQFDTKFEEPYANFSIPFHVTLGNHDNARDPVTGNSAFDQYSDVGIGHWYGTGNVEVAYTFREDRASDKWSIPSRYYDFQEGNATFLAMDTNTFMYWGFGASEDGDVPSPQEQEAWFDEAAAGATTPWKIAFGHHPYISNGEHGNAGDYESSMVGQDRPDDSIPRPDPVSGPYMEMFYEDHVCGNVDIVLTGHDHDLQWLEPHPDCPGTEFIVSGAAGKIRAAGNAERNPAYFQQFETYGFMWAQVTNSTFTGSFYDDSGALLFERSLTKDPSA